jgi:hypothetical protein
MDTPTDILAMARDERTELVELLDSPTPEQ